ncbi:hypothetical protein LXL04_020488 [Taraxacum kok-saghyz]
MGVASQEAINQFKALMDQDFKFVESLERFLKAREGNVTKAHKMLVDSLQWRLQNGIDDILAKPIIPANFYRGVRDSQLIGVSGYTREVTFIHLLCVNDVNALSILLTYYIRLSVCLRAFRCFPLVRASAPLKLKYNAEIEGNDSGIWYDTRINESKCVKVLDMSGLKLSALNQIKASPNRSTRYGIAKDLSDSSSTKAWLEKMKTLFISKGSGFSSRSVITGDPYKGVGEIGIPFEIAQKITFEERVTKYNMKFLQKLVDDNLCLKYQDGQNTYSLREGSEGHTFLKPGQIVHRKIMEGDVIFINRPPTTHKHSLQALSVYIHDDHTFKINPLICGPLSADFDGDCIHIFYPQSPEAKAEVLELFAVEKQLLSSHKISDRSVSRNETIRRIKLSPAHRAGTPLVPNLSKPGQPARLSRFGQFRGQTSQNLKDTKDGPHDTLTTVKPSRRYESRKTAHDQRNYRRLRSGTEMAIIPKPGLQMTNGQMIWKPNS